LLEEVAKKNETVALFLSDQRMPEMLGVDFLDKARKYFPEAKRVLLTAYSDTEAAIRAINEVQLDYYLMKPWDPPEEKLYPVLNELIDDWRASFRQEESGLRVIGFQFSPKSHAIKDFLSSNLFPYGWIDIEADERAFGLMQLHELQSKDLPVVITEDGRALKNPSLLEIASELGLSVQAQQEVYDVVIVGAGPAGLAAAVYGGSEGLKTLLIEKHAPGGQAGTSSRIENYLGFPNGLSGSDLSRRAISQVIRFGVEVIAPMEVLEITTKGQYKCLKLSSGEEVNARAVVITTGVQYRKLLAPGMDELAGAGIYYGAAMTEAGATKDKIVYMVGGGNSAGQGAVYLSKYAKQVYISIRRPDLTSSMSSYLIDQIDAIDNIEVLPFSEIVEAVGENNKLAKIQIKNVETDVISEKPADALFIFIGAKPHTEWINQLLKDEKGFLATGRDLLRFDQYKQVWKLDRDPFLLETCVPGIFAAGDVRSGAMNRVASAVGEGAMTISLVHKYLSEN
jgi:thioredoxin reductase (NADPH)